MKSNDIFLPLIVFLGFSLLNQIIDMFYLIRITEKMTQVFFNVYFISLFFLDIFFIYRLFKDLYYPDGN
jgi:hypothetical protein